MSTSLVALRAEVRTFIAEKLAAGAFVPMNDSWLAGWDEQFSRDLAERGWLGMTIPVEHGGHGRTYLERYVVTEELLSAGAPVAAHWIADRQIGPSLLRYGTAEQQAEFLPGIARGEVYFGIGMSEPDSGSDLASVRTSAVKVDGGWKLNGTKLWTSGAHHAHAFFALVRTTPRTEGMSRHDGLSQFLVRLNAPGVTVSPIRSIDGTSHFNEVSLADVFIPDSDVLGEIGQGWHQVTSELKFERSGPERFLSTMPALRALVDEAGGAEATDEGIGRYLARMAGLHGLSFTVARRLQDGESPELQASMVKVLGTLTEGDLADDVAEWSVGAARLNPTVEEAVTTALLRRPGFTLRGGTNEIIRGIIAKNLGQSVGLEPELDADLVQMVGEFFESVREGTEPGAAVDFDADVWNQLSELGLSRLTQDEEHGGSGASLFEAFALHRAAAAAGVPLPAVEHDLLGGWLAAKAGLPIDDALVTVAARVPGSDVVLVPWGRHAEHILVVDDSTEGSATVTSYQRGDLDLEEAVDIAGVPRDRVRGIVTEREAVSIDASLVAEYRLRGALARAFQISGALDRSVQVAKDYAAVRHQFGRPLMAFQAVQALLADAAAEAAVVRAAVLRAVRVMLAEGAPHGDVEMAVAIAKSVASHATGLVVRNTHQVLGAIGTTMEHELHRYTQPALAWREDFGSGTQWDRLIGAAARAKGVGVLWGEITSASHLAD